MREIKFRQWIGDKFEYWGIGIDDTEFIGPCSGGNVRITQTPHQQFTGLHDKNGKEIYEGDILCFTGLSKQHQTPFVMAWNEKEARWTDYSPKYAAEIIGNIYENPDLLEKGHG